MCDCRNGDEIQRIALVRSGGDHQWAAINPCGLYGRLYTPGGWDKLWMYWLQAQYGRVGGVVLLVFAVSLSVCQSVSRRGLRLAVLGAVCSVY